MLILVFGDHSHDVLHVLLAAQEDGAPLVQLPRHKVENGLPGMKISVILVIKVKCTAKRSKHYPEKLPTSFIKVGVI